MTEPPPIASFLLKIFSSPVSHYSYFGDLEEGFNEILESQGKRKARFWYWKQILKVIPLFIKESMIWSATMFKNYLKMALRNFWNNKGYSLINILGLGIGLTCTLFIYLWVQNELSYDRFHEKKRDIFQVCFKVQHTNGPSQIHQGSFYPFAPILKEECTGILDAVRIRPTTGLLVQYGEKTFDNDNIIFTDPSFLNMFTFNLLKGNPQTALSNNQSMVITKKMAKKYFGDENPLGKRLTVNKKFDVYITGVVTEVPQNSSVRFDCLLSFQHIFSKRKVEERDWGMNPGATFVLLKQAPGVQGVAENIKRTLFNHNPFPPEMKVSVVLHPFTRLHLHSVEGGGRITSIIIFSIIALFVLIIACINFVNLATSRYANRVVEVGLRKVVGAGKSDLTGQFFCESIFLTLLAFLLAIILALVLFPTFESILGQKLPLTVFTNPYIVLGIVGIVVLTGLLSGIYPSFFLASFQPVKVLGGRLRAGSKSSLFRKVLVVIQFSISIFLIFSSIGIYRQLTFVKNKNLGYDKKNLVYIPITGNLGKEYSTFKNECLKNPHILNITRSFQQPGYIGSSVSKLDWEGKNPKQRVSMNFEFVDYNYFKTFGMKIIEGRAFSKEFPSDKKEAYIVNQEAVKLMGFKDPVGKRLSVFGNEGRIIGVVKNFHFQPLHFGIQPFVCGMDPGWGDIQNNIFIRTDEQNFSTTVKSLSNLYEKINPGYPFNWYFFEEVIKGNYKTETQLGRIVGVFTILAIFIACLGLFGLASFMAQQRTKEIGVRKVLGASAINVLILQSKEMVKWVLLANVIAWPAGYYFLKILLSDYAYRIPIGYDLFCISGLLVIFIALLTVSYQSIKGALANPIDSIRYQ